MSKQVNHKEEISLSFLKERYVLDLIKPDVDAFKRAAIIQSLIEEKGWTQRELARRFNVPHSTVQDWLLFNTIAEEEYNKMLKSGFKQTDIYRTLREKRGDKSKVISDVDVFLVEVRTRIRGYRKNKVYSPKTMHLIDEVVNELNSFGCDINLQRRK